MAVVGRQPHPRDPHVPVLDQFGPRADDGAKVDFADDPRRDRGGSAIAERLAAVEINDHQRSEEHTSELQSLMRISYAVFCLKKKNNKHKKQYTIDIRYKLQHIQQNIT